MSECVFLTLDVKSAAVSDVFGFFVPFAGQLLENMIKRIIILVNERERRTLLIKWKDISLRWPCCALVETGAG